MINEYQVRLLVRATRELSAAALATYSVRQLRDLPPDHFERLTELPEYEQFMVTCYATGFVCRDLAPKLELDRINSRPSEAVPAWSLPEIRIYFHTLLRAERWDGGTWSHIFDALRAGTLIQAVDRLESDKSLYALR